VRLLFVADGRSPIAQSWIGYFAQAGHEVHLVSTFPVESELALASLSVIPVAFSGAGGSASRPGAAPGGARGIGARAFLRHWLGPLTLPAAGRRLHARIETIRPDIVHALRIPYEGMLAAAAAPSAPFVASVWGNDFTLHAPASPAMRSWTRRVLGKAAALHVDCRRDMRLAREWGFPAGRPVLLLPTNGGVRSQIFHPVDEGGSEATVPGLGAIPPEAPVLINPRGFRSYIRSDTFFRSLPFILAECPEAHILCPAMEGEPEAERWLDVLSLRASTHLLPRLSPEQMAALYQRAAVTVSLSEHDGTPNTLLEAMACGCFPVAGDLESIREWIEPERTGFLVDVNRPDDVAHAVVRALRHPDLRREAAQHNTRHVVEQASYARRMPEVEARYRQLAGAHAGLRSS
jgi:glycosyltransferase involved in cell wall biosynthesis